MKRVLFLLMVFVAIFAVVGGIVESRSWHSERPGAHIAVATLFIFLCIVHIIVMRKGVWRYITGAARLPADPRQKRRQIMRRVTIYLMLIFGLLTIIGAVIGRRLTGLPVFHVVMASIFILFILRHVSANRKAILRYFTAGTKKAALPTTSRIEDAID